MSEHKPEWPESGDLVIATIESVMDYGAYANLDEYNKRGFLHISEISSARIRNLHDFIRERQKIVLKVLRVDLDKGHIDLSLRRVTKRERIEKIKVWKKDRKGEVLLRTVAEKLGLPVDEVYQKAGVILEQNDGIYEGFEKALKEGPEALTKLGIPEDIAKAFGQIAEERLGEVAHVLPRLVGAGEVGPRLAGESACPASPNLIGEFQVGQLFDRR